MRAVILYDTELVEDLNLASFLMSADSILVQPSFQRDALVPKFFVFQGHERKSIVILILSSNVSPYCTKQKKSFKIISLTEYTQKSADYFFTFFYSTKLSISIPIRFLLEINH